MKIKHILIILLALPIFSCERLEHQDEKREEGAPILFSLNTKSLLDGQRTYRVIVTNTSGQLKGNGTYCNEIITPGDMGSWLSPCRVNNDGLPTDSENHVVSDFDEADKSSINGLRFTTNYYQENFNMTAASPAVQIKTENGRVYFQWSAENELYLSGSMMKEFEGSWVQGSYILNPKNYDALTLIDRRAKLFIHIECGEQPTATIQSIALKHVTKARWIIPDGFSTSNYEIVSNPLFESHGNPDEFITLVKENNDHWDSAEEGIYILPLDYREKANENMRPQVVLQLGSGPKPIDVPVFLSDFIEPMKNYLLTLKVSKSHVQFMLSSSNWDDGGTSSLSEEEKWATISYGTVSTWDTLSPITTDPWNGSWN